MHSIVQYPFTIVNSHPHFFNCSLCWTCPTKVQLLDHPSFPARFVHLICHGTDPSKLNKQKQIIICCPKRTSSFQSNICWRRCCENNEASSSINAPLDGSTFPGVIKASYFVLKKKYYKIPLGQVVPCSLCSILAYCFVVTSFKW